MWLAPIAAVAYLESAVPFASNRRQMAIAELDLTNWPACGVKLAENDGRAVLIRAECLNLKRGVSFFSVSVPKLFTYSLLGIS